MISIPNNILSAFKQYFQLTVINFFHQLYTKKASTPIKVLETTL